LSSVADVARRLSEAIGLSNATSRVAAGLVVVFVLGTAVSIETTGALLSTLEAQVVGSFGGLLVAIATGALFLVVLLAVHPVARSRLGSDDSRPEFGTLAWFAMLFSAGLASDLLYWSASEPILHHQGNPFLMQAGIAAASEAAVQPALRITVLHWGLHGWAFYVLAALGIGIYSYRHGRPLSFRSAFFPLLGPRWIDRWPGRGIDLIALFGTICGVATSIGFAAAGIDAAFGSLIGSESSLSNQVAIVVCLCALGTASALSGLARGIRRLSELNVWLSALLLLCVLLLGPTAELVAGFAATLVDYLAAFVPAGAWIGSTAEERAWQSTWTVFYWCWWLAWMPFVSLFIARISRGRTIREFVCAVMLVPALVIVLWMSIMGGTALSLELASPGAVSAAVARDYALGLTTVIEALAAPPLASALIGLATLLLVTWLITSLDSATLVIGHLLDVPETTPSKVFWGGTLAAVTCALLGVGGVPALQAASIVIGLPLGFLTIALGAGLLRELLRGRL
jgi:choline/glycine/proline betaine transport protein